MCRRNASCEHYGEKSKLCQDNDKAYMLCGIWGVVDIELVKL